MQFQLKIPIQIMAIPIQFNSYSNDGEFNSNNGNSNSILIPELEFAINSNSSGIDPDSGRCHVTQLGWVSCNAVGGGGGGCQISWENKRYEGYSKGYWRLGEMGGRPGKSIT